VSGGGGWGAKRGLLSLDPDTRHVLPQDDTVDRFHRILEQRMDSDAAVGAQDGIVSPGSFVQFFVTPSASRRPEELPLGHKYVFGTAPWGYAEPTTTASKPGGIVARKDSFGGLTTHGLFLGSGSDSSQGSSGVLYSKIDVPHSFVFG